MLKAMMVAVAVWMVGCAEPISTDVAVGPGAAKRWELVVSAVDALNDQIGEDVFTVGPATGDGAVEGHVTVELVQEIAGRVAGETNRRNAREQITITIDMKTNVVQMAHELGHAAGLEHSSDPENFMYLSATKLGVSDQQRDYLIDLM